MSFTLAILAATTPALETAPAPQLAYSADVPVLADANVGDSQGAALVRAGEKTASKPSALDEDGGDDSGIKFSPSITLVSDYRFRGISLSGRDPAIQAGIEASSNGFYAGIWSSNIALYAGTHMELDVYGGWRGNVAGLDVDVGATTYLYPGGKGAKYAELLGSVGHTIGPVELKAGIAYAPAQKNLGSDNFYAYGQARSGVPGTPISLTASVGHENGSVAGPTGKKWDWSLGGEYVYKKFTAGVKYVDTNITALDDPSGNTKPGVVASLGWAF